MPLCYGQFTSTMATLTICAVASLFCTNPPDFLFVSTSSKESIEEFESRMDYSRISRESANIDALSFKRNNQKNYQFFLFCTFLVPFAHFLSPRCLSISIFLAFFRSLWLSFALSPSLLAIIPCTSTPTFLLQQGHEITQRFCFCLFAFWIQGKNQM